MVNELSVAGRNRTLILASTSGASAEGQGARALIDGLPDRTIVDAAIVISQPGFDEPFEPHLVTAAGLNGPPVGLAQTAEEILRDRAELSPGQISAPAQIARYAIPAASGEQAGLIEDGLDAITITSAGELPLPASENDRDRFDTDTLERIGPAIIALVSAVDASASAPATGPGNFLWVGNNLLPGWSIGLVVLALLLPPLAVAASILARATRDGGRIGRGFSWALEWWIPALVLCLGVYALSVVDVIPATGVPYDPAGVELGASEAIALVLLLVLAGWLWWVLHLRRIPGSARAVRVRSRCGPGGGRSLSPRLVGQPLSRALACAARSSGCRARHQGAAPGGTCGAAAHRGRPASGRGAHLCRLDSRLGRIAASAARDAHGRRRNWRDTGVRGRFHARIGDCGRHFGACNRKGDLKLPAVLGKPGVGPHARPRGYPRTCVGWTFVRCLVDCRKTMPGTESK